MNIPMNRTKPHENGFYLCRKEKSRQLPELVYLMPDEDGVMLVVVQILTPLNKPQMFQMPLSKFKRAFWSERLEIEDWWAAWGG